MAKVLILAGDYSEDYEVMCSYVTLRAAGHEVDVAAPYKKAGDSIRTSLHEFEFPEEDTYSEKPGHRFVLNATFADVTADDYDGVLCPGGRGAEYIRCNEDVRSLIRQFAEANKPMASICNGLQVYMEADVLEGRRCTGWPELKHEAQRAGANWIDIEFYRGVTEDKAYVDGNFVSAAVWGCLSSMLAEFLGVLGAQVKA